MISFAQKHRIARIARLPIVRVTLVVLACVLWGRVRVVMQEYVTSGGTNGASVGWTLFRVGDRLTFNPPSNIPVREVGWLRGEIQVVQLGGHTRWKKTITLSSPTLDVASGYDGPKPPQALIEDLYLRQLSVTQGSPIQEGLASASFGKTIVYFHDPALEWREVLLRLRGRALLPIALGLTLVVLVTVIRRRTRAHVHLDGRCRSCGYDMRGARGVVCPECGSD